MAPERILVCDADGCLHLGVYNPVLLVDHDGPKGIPNPLRVQMRVDLDKPTERLLKVCREHTAFPIECYALQVDWSFLREVMHAGAVYDIQRNTNRIGLQFEGPELNGQPDIIPHPGACNVFGQKTFHDFGEVRNYEKR